MWRSFIECILLRLQTGCLRLSRIASRKRRAAHRFSSSLEASAAVFVRYLQTSCIAFLLFSFLVLCNSVPGLRNGTSTEAHVDLQEHCASDLHESHDQIPPVSSRWTEVLSLPKTHELPDGYIFSVGAKRFRLRSVIPTRRTMSSQTGTSPLPASNTPVARRCSLANGTNMIPAP